MPNFPHRPLPPGGYLDADADADRGPDVYDDEDEGDGSGREMGGQTDGETDGEMDVEVRRRRTVEKRLEGLRRGAMARERNLGVLVGILRRCVAEGDMVRAKRAFGLLVRSHVDGRKVDLRNQGYWGLGAEILMRGGERPAEVENGGEGKKRWGSVQNMVLVRRYFEDLIQLYPYNRLHTDSTSALDYYPVLFSCEVYNVHVELEMALRRVEEEGEDDGQMIDEYEAPEKRVKEELRRGALEVMRGVAGRMDELMLVLPYSKSLEMLRLRGMIALFMGDLEVQAQPREEGEEDEGTRKRETERERAVMLFKKVLAGGGELEPWIRSLVAEHGGEDDEGESSDEDDGPATSLPMFSSLPIR